MSFDSLQILQQLAVGIGYAIGQSNFLTLLDLHLKRQLIVSLHFHALIQKLILQSLLHKGDVAHSFVGPFGADAGEQERIQALTSIIYSLLWSSACRSWSSCRCSA